MRGSCFIAALLLCASITAQWESVGGGFDFGQVHQLHWDAEAERLYAVGSFSSLNDLGITDIQGAAYWENGTWQGMGTGVAFSGAHPATCILPYGDGYLIAGHFRQVGGVSNTRTVAHWHSGAWHSFGLDSSQVIGSVPHRLTILEDTLHLVGTFSFRNAEGDTIRNWAKWTGQEWVACDPEGNFNYAVSALQEYQGDLYVGGNFQTLDGVYDIVRRGPDGYEQLGGGLVGDPSVHHMRVYDGLLWVAGIFSGAAGVYSPGIIVWDGQQWRDPFPMINVVAQGRWLEVIGGKLYFTSSFQVAGLPGSYHLARYDGQQLCILAAENEYANRIAGSADTLYLSTCQFLYCATSTGPQMNYIAKLPMDVEPVTCFDVVLGMEEQAVATATLAAHPNPSSGLVEVAWPGTQAGMLEVRTAQGALVLRQRWPAGAGRMVLDLGHLADGLYLLRMEGAAGTAPATTRIILQR